MVAFEMLITFPARLNNYPDMQIKFPVNFLREIARNTL